MPGRKLTAVVLLLIIALVILALIRSTSSGPTFRAANYSTLDECLNGIPREWLSGSLEREGAEWACEHRERVRRGER